MNLTHHFLVSMPIITDDYFSRSVIYLIEHNEEGAWGVVVNKPIGLKLGDIFDQLDIEFSDDALGNTEVLRGGPVDEQQGIVLHRPGHNFDATKNFSSGVSMSSSKDVLEALATGNAPDDCRVFLGHAGWEAGQLESEIADNAWLTDPASADQLFDTDPDELRNAVAANIGVNLNLLSTQTGHA